MGVHQLKLQREIKYMKASILQNFSPCFPASFLLFNFLPLNQIFLLLPLWHQAPKRVTRRLHSHHHLRHHRRRSHHHHHHHHHHHYRHMQVLLLPQCLPHHVFPLPPLDPCHEGIE